jgi:hypothetical protein
VNVARGRSMSPETEQLKGASPREGDIGPKPESSASTKSEAEEAIGPQDWRAGQIREWLLALLRFALTREPRDEAAATAVAEAIDSIGTQRGRSASNFFRRTSREVCRAIATPGDPKRVETLKKHLARIEDNRLRRAFQVTVELEDKALRSSTKARQRNLWSGLRR